MDISIYRVASLLKTDDKIHKSEDAKSDEQTNIDILYRVTPFKVLKNIISEKNIWFIPCTLVVFSSRYANTFKL